MTTSAGDRDAADEPRPRGDALADAPPEAVRLVDDLLAGVHAAPRTASSRCSRTVGYQRRSAKTTAATRSASTRPATGAAARTISATSPPMTANAATPGPSRSASGEKTAHAERRVVGRAAALRPVGHERPERPAADDRQQRRQERQRDEHGDGDAHRADRPEAGGAVDLRDASGTAAPP